MLNIYEIEALILADFDKFKEINQNKDWNFDSKDAAIMPDSKGIIKRFTNQEPIIAVTIPLLRLPIIAENHTYFRDFLTNFEKMIAERAYTPTPF